MNTIITVVLSLVVEIPTVILTIINIIEKIKRKNTNANNTSNYQFAIQNNINQSNFSINLLNYNYTNNSYNQVFESKHLVNNSRDYLAEVLFIIYAFVSLWLYLYSPLLVYILTFISGLVFLFDSFLNKTNKSVKIYSVVNIILSIVVILVCHI